MLDFSNRTFVEFITDSTGLNIYDARYDHWSGSKANRLRKLWEVEEHGVVVKLMADKRYAVYHERLTTSFFEGHRRDGPTFITFVIRPDEARVRSHFDVPTKE